MLLLLDEIVISLSRYSPNRYASISARLITRVNRKSRHFKINSEVTALSIAGIRVPEMKKAPSHFILSAVSNSYSIIQIRSNYVKLPQTKTREQRAEKRPQNTPKNRLSVNHFGHHLTLFLPSFWPVNHLRTTKNWVKTVLVFPNLVKLYQPV